MTKKIWAAPLLALGIAACGSPETADQAATDQTMDPMATDGMAQDDAAGMQMQEATATLQMADGTEAGTATATAANDGIRISLTAMGLESGERGAHIHMTGTCEGPSFESAGSHWNPTDDQHGLENPEGQHAGDMPNLTIAEDGTGTLEYTLEGGTFDGLLDADGSAMVIHAGRDDQRTDPSGDSGSRIACGTFSAA